MCNLAIQVTKNGMHFRYKQCELATELPMITAFNKCESTTQVESLFKKYTLDIGKLFSLSIVNVDFQNNKFIVL